MQGLKIFMIVDWSVNIFFSNIGKTIVFNRGLSIEVEMPKKFLGIVRVLGLKSTSILFFRTMCAFFIGKYKNFLSSSPHIPLSKSPPSHRCLLIIQLFLLSAVVGSFRP